MEVCRADLSESDGLIFRTQSACGLLSECHSFGRSDNGRCSGIVNRDSSGWAVVDVLRALLCSLMVMRPIGTY